MCLRGDCSLEKNACAFCGEHWRVCLKVLAKKNEAVALLSSRALVLCLLSFPSPWRFARHSKSGCERAKKHTKPLPRNSCCGRHAGSGRVRSPVCRHMLCCRYERPFLHSPYPHDPPRKRSRGAARLVKRASALADAQLPQGRSRVCASSLDACAPRADFFSRCGRAARRVRARASRAKAQCHGHRVTSREARDCHTGRVTTPDRGAVPRRRGGWSSAHARMQGEVWAHTVTHSPPW